MSSATDAFSSVAGRLIQSSVDAVVAMSASVLAPTSTRFFVCFYHDLATGISVPLALEHARQNLYDHPRRYLFTPHPDMEEGQPVTLRDWWLPHLYQHRILTLQATSTSIFTATHEGRTQVASTFPRFNAAMPPKPRYRFGGRAWELLQIERHLLGQRLVILSGFGGIGKTALAREAADWLTRTGLYASACFVSFEHGGDASLLLSELGTFLGVNDSHYNSSDLDAALALLVPALLARPTLLIADNLECLLPGGEAPLKRDERQQLWHLLRTLASQGVGVLLTSRDPLEQEEELATSLEIARLSLLGLTPLDAYALASRLLTALAIDRTSAPYVELHTLLEQLAYQPLALQLVLPALREYPIARILSDFTRLLSTFTDDTVTGRNHSLLTSLEYSLHRLSAKQRALLSRLAIFEGGAREDDLLIITRIPKNNWASLKTALLQSALLILEPIQGFTEPFLRFHPILTPFLRGQTDVLSARFTVRYVALAEALYDLDAQHPQAVRALFAKELPNLRRALALLLAQGHQQGLEEAIELVHNLAFLLNKLGRWRERDALRQQLVSTLTEQAPTTKVGTLTRTTYLQESGLGQDELSQGNLTAASARFTRLLAVIEAQPIDSPRGPGSHEHCIILIYLARCLARVEQLAVAEGLYHQALTILNDTLLRRQPKNDRYLRLRSVVLCELANLLRDQGRYSQAREFYLQALAVSQQLGDQSSQADDEGQLGNLALKQGNLVEARQRHQTALATFQALRDPEKEAAAWHNMGAVAQQEQQWDEAEHCYRMSLALHERKGYHAGIAKNCEALADLAWATNRFAEAEAWYRRAQVADALAHPGNPDTDLLGKLARLLVNEVRSGRIVPTNLTEAHTLAEQALALRANRDTTTETWYDLETQARLAELEKQPEHARVLRRLAREAYIAFPGHRFHLAQQMGPLIAEIVAATQGDEATRKQVIADLLQWEAKDWHLIAPTQHLWAGERDWTTLTEELDNQNALLILLILEALATPPEIVPISHTTDSLVTELPPATHDAASRDQAALAQAFTELTFAEQQRVLSIIQAQAIDDAGAESEEHS